MMDNLIYITCNTVQFISQTATCIVWSPVNTVTDNTDCSIAAHVHVIKTLYSRTPMSTYRQLEYINTVISATATATSPPPPISVTRYRRHTHCTTCCIWQPIAIYRSCNVSIIDRRYTYMLISIVDLYRSQFHIL